MRSEEHLSMETEICVGDFGEAEGESACGETHSDLANHRHGSRRKKKLVEARTVHLHHMTLRTRRRLHFLD